jgi:AraC family transcriptional regulator, positive regulator of tynA and feaB
MKCVFSTEDVRPGERYDFWRDTTRRYLAANDTAPDEPENFSLKMAAAELGELTLISVTTGLVTCTHSRRHIESTADELMLIRQTRGQMSMHHNNHELTLDAGQMTLIDPRLVYTCRYGADAALVVVKCPRRSLAARIGNMESHAGRKLVADSGITGLLSELIGVLPRHAAALDVTAEQTSNQVLDLLAASLLKVSGGGVPRTGASRRMLAHRLSAAIDRALMDHTATAETIAQSAGMSLRYANSILSEYHDTSVTRLLLARRLERCRQILADPLCLHRSISTVAYGWGFADLTHFARTFRRAFGLAPNEYRQRHTAPK